MHPLWRDGDEGSASMSERNTREEILTVLIQKYQMYRTLAKEANFNSRKERDNEERAYAINELAATLGYADLNVEEAYRDAQKGLDEMTKGAQA